MEEIHCFLSEEHCQCDACGDKLRPFGQKVTREEVTFIPATLKKKVYIEHSYECLSCRKAATHSIKRAQAPKAVLQRSFAGPSVLAWLFHQKYELSLPLYRQEKEWEQYGLLVSQCNVWLYELFQNPSNAFHSFPASFRDKENPLTKDLSFHRLMEASPPSFRKLDNFRNFLPRMLCNHCNAP